MKIKTHNKRGIMWVLVIFSLVFLTANTQAEEKSKPRFSIKLTGGLGCFNWGDINTYLESFDDCLSKRTHYKGGETRKLNYGLDFEEELRIDLNSKFGIGLSIGIISGECKSKFTYKGPFPLTSWPSANQSYFFKHAASAIPIKLGGYYTLPLNSKFNLFLNVGLGYYFAKSSFYKHHLSSSFGPACMIYTKNEKYDLSSKGFGFYGGVGFEFSICENWALVIEGQGRYVKLKNLKGSKLNSDFFDFRQENIGVLYYVEGPLLFYGDEPWPDLVITKIYPSNPDFRTIRKAVLDFSGFSLRIGIRMKLF